MAIGVDDLFGPVPNGGGQGRVIITLLHELGAIDPETRYTLYSTRPIRPGPTPLDGLPPNFSVVQVPSRKAQLTFLAWHTVRRPDITRWLGPQDVLHATTPAVVPALAGAALVLTVHDLVWWRFPHGLKPWGRFFHRSGLYIAAREAAAIATVSDATRDDVVARLGSRVQPRRVVTIPNSAARDFREPTDRDARMRALRERFDLRGAYVVTVGTWEPRKNHRRLLQAFARLPEQVRREHALVIVGARGWKMPAVEELIDELGLAESVRWTGHLADDDLATLLTGARVLAYPSLYEGFGIPILEAMLCDVPVITSNVSSMPEVAGDAALLVDPLDVDALTSALARVLGDAELRRELVARGRIQRERFSSRRMAAAYRALYDSVAAGERVPGDA